MSRVRDKADFQFAGEDYTHGAGVRYVANAITTTDLDASGTISNIHLQDIADVATVSASVDGYFLKYDHGTTAFVWSQVSGGGGGTMNNLVDDTTPQLGGNLESNGFNIEMADNNKIALGTGERGKLEHTGASGKLQLFSTTGGIDIRTTANDEVIAISSDDGSGGIANYIIADGSTGATELYHYGSKKLATTSSGAEVTGNLTVSGNFTVNGTTTTINTTELTVSDNIITLNNDETGTPSQNAGIAVERGTSANVDIRWNETTDKWQFTNDGTTYTDIGSGGASTGDISFNASTISSSGNTVTIDDALTVTGTITSSQAGAPIITSASNLTLQAVGRVHVDQSPLRLYNVSASNRNTLTAADGDLVYDSDVNSVFAFQNGSWVNIGGGGSGSSTTNDILTITTSSALPSAPSSGSVHIFEDNSTLTFMNSRAGTGHYQMQMKNSAGTFVFGVDGLGNAITSSSGSMRAQYFYAVSNTSYYVAPALTTTAMQLAGDIKTDGSYIGSIKERSSADTSTSGTLNFDSKDYEIYRLTQNQTANRTINIRGDGSTTLDSIMSNNEFKTVAVAFKNGSSPYYFNTVQVDSNTITVLWSGGSAPSAGNASSTDFYTFSICKTGSATFEVYGSLTKFS